MHRVPIAWVQRWVFVGLTMYSTGVLASSFDEYYDPKFTDRQEIVLSAAASKAYQALFADDDIYRCIFRVCKFENKDADTVERLYGAKWNTRGDLFNQQWMIFSQFEKRNRDFPPIEFKHFDDPESFAWARANYGKVWVSDENGGLQWKGSFDVSINAAKLRADETLTGWAGVIAHEMLHNLSHSHPDPTKVGLDEAYKTDYLINAAQSCIASQNARFKNFALVQRCGGRQ